MSARATENKKIELWDGYEVEVDMQLLDDFDFIEDFNAAMNENNLGDLMTMYMALVGGEKTYEDVRKHITDEYGYMSKDGLTKITKKIDDTFPKAGNRAQRRSWKTSR